MDVNMELISMMMTIQTDNHRIPPQRHLSTTHFNPQFDSSYATFPSQMTDFEKQNSMAAMREMIFRMAAMQPIQIDPEAIKPPKRKNVKISKDPQSVAARHRRERISEKIRILQRLVPGGTKMDTASMLDEAIHYVKFLKKQVQRLERGGTGTVAVGGFVAESGAPVRMMESNQLMVGVRVGVYTTTDDVLNMKGNG